MKITAVDTAYISIPLKRTFKTARREAGFAQAIIVRITAEGGHYGYGEAAITPAVTGETRASIEAAIILHLAPAIIGKDLDYFDDILRNMNACILQNTSAKAAVDIALYDIKSSALGVSLRQFLGGGINSLSTCLTISLNTPEQMATDSVAALREGFTSLKLKLGGSLEQDLARASAVRAAVGSKCSIMADANQGWGAKQAVRIITQMEDMGLNLELIEQPVPAWNYDAMSYVTKNVRTLIAADESVFSQHDAAKLLKDKCADIINIKLMKTGGIYGALALCEVAAAFGAECMIGCMLEAGLAVNAAAQLAAARSCITWRDLDAPFLCADYIFGGACFTAGEILLPQAAGTACCAASLFGTSAQ